MTHGDNVWWVIGLSVTLGVFVGAVLASMLVLSASAIEYRITWQVQHGREVYQEYTSQVDCELAAFNLGDAYVCVPGPVYVSK